MDAMASSNKDIDDFLIRGLGSLVEKLAEYEKSFALKTSADSLNLNSYTFNALDAHNDIVVENSFNIHAKGANGYKYAIMNPSI